MLGYKLIRCFAASKTQLIYSRLGQYHDEYQAMMKQILDQTLSTNKMKRFNKLERKVQIYNQFHGLISQIEDLNSILKDKQASKDDKEFAKEELEQQKQLLDELQDVALNEIIPDDEFDSSTQIKIEIRPGVGGSEGSLFAEDILNMFQNYAGMQGWNCQVLTHNQDQQIGKGCKLGVLQMDGEDCYYKMRCEAGVHKVIRVPETESKGRLHSSTCSVAVLPVVVDEFKIDQKDIRFDFMRASGPGGQHVNKTDSACRATYIPTGLAVAIQDDRCQDRNKQRAIEILTQKLFIQHVEKQQAKLASSRKEQIGGGDRSDKIRTYNFPQQRISDHRTGLTLFGMDKMMEGTLLDEFIDSYLMKIKQKKLEDLLEELNQQL